MIDDQLAKKIVGMLKASFGMPAESFKYEIQDDWKFLLISVVFDPMIMNSDIQTRLRLAQGIVAGMIPSRHGEYAWMVNAVQQGIVVESTFGGDTTSPSSGML